MKETLYIRIACQDTDAIQWLITNDDLGDEIASGELVNKDFLVELTEKAYSRNVVVLVNGADVGLHSLTVPGKSEKAIKSAAPYMLEDDLAQDVELLFFAFANRPPSYEGDDNCFMAVVSTQQLDTWLSWFAQAEIMVNTMLPDVLAMPEYTDAWSTVNINEQLLLRCGPWQGAVLDTVFAELIIGQYVDKLAQPQAIKHFSELNIDHQNVLLQPQPEELPMLLLAQGAKAQSFNLLQGEYQVKKQRSPMVKNWLLVAGVAVFALFLNIFGKIFELNQLDNQYQVINASIEENYKKVFPKTRKVRISTVKGQITRELSQYGAGAGESGVLVMLQKVQPAFVKVPLLKPDSIRYDGKRQELRLSVTGSDYQSFERFKEALEQSSLEVSTGAQNNQGDKVAGSFNIRSK